MGEVDSRVTLDDPGSPVPDQKTGNRRWNSKRQALGFGVGPNNFLRYEFNGNIGVEGKLFIGIPDDEGCLRKWCMVCGKTTKCRPIPSNVVHE